MCPSKLSRHSICLALAAACLLAGCSEPPVKSSAELDAAELLALFQERQQADAKNFVEFDLGRFRITHSLRQGSGQLHVQFHLFGVLPQERLELLNQVLPQYDKRVRDAIIGLIQRTETEHLTDPSLTFLKEELAAIVNRTLQQRLLMDVAFSDFSTDCEAGMPWSLPVTEVKEKKGGHGGHGGH
jgi:hypothetical protein